ncbi:uncharacterized protein LOC113759218 [Coffea eugenioides]|uniref:Uncharacterized protein n=1 Tax=Coffea arabica TaxID=13443 RepID=A0A6P6W5L3_COFAR|nr:uncharacterized protein LOC113729773 [Coffea arabica]XP_027157589.1 uncharacterized protein LOC113759218 [Coffea eugenioides]
MKTTTKAKKQSTLMVILKAPARVLKKITEFYMNSMFDCAARIGDNTVVNCGIAPQVSQQLPRNFSVNSSKDSKQEDELRELIRAVSTKLSEANAGIKTIDPQLQRPITSVKLPAKAAEKRSYSVGIGRIGRIDEDMPCDFKEADSPIYAYPRCKSYAVTSRNAVVR